LDGNRKSKLGGTYLTGLCKSSPFCGCKAEFRHRLGHGSKGWIATIVIGSKICSRTAWNFKGNEIFFHIPSKTATRPLMMGLQILGAPALLASPAIALEYLLAKLAIRIPLQAKARMFWDRWFRHASWRWAKSPAMRITEPHKDRMVEEHSRLYHQLLRFWCYFPDQTGTAANSRVWALFLNIPKAHERYFEFVRTT
jgi:hypothetical protein